MEFVNNYYYVLSNVNSRFVLLEGAAKNQWWLEARKRCRSGQKCEGISTEVQNVIANVFTYIDHRVGEFVRSMRIQNDKKSRVKRPHFAIAIQKYGVQELYVILYDLTLRPIMNKGFTYLTQGLGPCRRLEVPRNSDFAKMREQYKEVPQATQAGEVSRLLMTKLGQNFHRVYEEYTKQIQQKDDTDNNAKHVHFMVFLLLVLEHCARVTQQDAVVKKVVVEEITEIKEHLEDGIYGSCDDYMLKMPSLPLEEVGLNGLKITTSQGRRMLMVNQWVPPQAVRALRQFIVSICNLATAKKYSVILKLDKTDYTEESLYAEPKNDRGTKKRRV